MGVIIPAKVTMGAHACPRARETVLHNKHLLKEIGHLIYATMLLERAKKFCVVNTQPVKQMPIEHDCISSSNRLPNLLK